MSITSHKFLRLLGLILLGLVVIALSVELFFSPRINPVALTRHAIEQCERVEIEVVSAVSNRTLSTDYLKAAFGSVVKQSKAFREGYLRTTEGVQPNVLDAWKQPLQMMARSNLLTVPNVSPALLLKTNEVIIWSSGPNGSNEFGNGDDVFLQPR
jgi:hypothetical protein